MKTSLSSIAIVLLLSGAPAIAQERAGLSRSAVEILNRLDQLENEIRQLRGDMEVVNHELSGIKRRQRELYLDIDRRLGELELGGVRKSTQQAPVSDQVPVAQPPVQQPADTAPSVQAQQAEQPPLRGTVARRGVACGRGPRAVPEAGAGPPLETSAAEPVPGCGGRSEGG